MNAFKEIQLSSVVDINARSYSSKDSFSSVYYLDTGNITQNTVDKIVYYDLEQEKLPSRARRKIKLNSVVYSTVRPNQRHYGIIRKEMPSNFLVSTGFAVIDAKQDYISPEYLYYFLTQNEIVETLQSIAEQSVSTYPSITAKDIGNLQLRLPPVETQKRIASILRSLDDKIELNNRINANLEELLLSVFKNCFAIDIAHTSENNCPVLGDLVTVIDNRGKTPPLVTNISDYPIIDVGALKGKGRIIEYGNCTKYVNETTYHTWFRSGHPRKWDILLSTVGSIAEMKVFLGNKGCIAQNVVALRSIHVSPLYLYQYLLYIRDDLIAYNIGSVQPSIKVTHIIKHPIYIPNEQQMKNFDDIARSLTNLMYNNYIENEKVKAIRDSLLPKLMSGELDVSKVKL